MEEQRPLPHYQEWACWGHMEEVRETMRCVKGKSRRGRLGARDGIESGVWVGVDEKDTRKKYPKVGEWNVEILEEQEEIKGERGHKEWDWAESGNQRKKKENNTKPIRTPQNKRLSEEGWDENEGRNGRWRKPVKTPRIEKRHKWVEGQWLRSGMHFFFFF